MLFSSVLLIFFSGLPPGLPSDIMLFNSRILQILKQSLGFPLGYIMFLFAFIQHTLLKSSQSSLLKFLLENLIH
jgi:hypothetical protein